MGWLATTSQPEGVEYMNIYDSTADYISNIPLMKAWPAATTLLEQAAFKKPRDWRLPILTCETVGGNVSQAIPAAASIACALIGILLIDDMLDDDPRGEFHRIGAAQAANFASAFLAASSQAIVQSEALPKNKLLAMKSLSQMMASISLGQYLDVQNPSDEAGYWKVVELKSSSFFRSAFELGALFGNAPVEVVNRIGEIGSLYGEMIQIHDDLNDTMQVPANSDWIQRRSALPILFARLVDHPARARFEELYPYAGSNSRFLKEAQEILIQCGAVSYCIYQLLNRHQTVLGILSTLPVPHSGREGLTSFVEQMVVPAYRLFEEVSGVPFAPTTFKIKADGE